MNPLGIAAALAAFLGIWLGHVTVRRVEARARRLWIPILCALILGLGLESWSLLTKSLLWSTVLGILGFTVLWDALEFVRQQNRIRRGHAPANADNPRHARILKEHHAASTADLLDREPNVIPAFTGRREW